MIRCQEEAMEIVRRDTGLSVTVAQVEEVLNGKRCCVSVEAGKIIRQAGRAYAQRILSAVMESGFDLQAIPSVFVGGGAGLFKRYVTPQDRLCRLVTLSDVNLTLPDLNGLRGR